MQPTYSSVSSYSQNNQLQIRDADEFLSYVVQRMNWTQIEQDVVMDIGCGTGNFVRKMLLPLIPNVKKIVALDILPSMIQFANESNCHEKIEYVVADFRDPFAIKKWTQSISKVVSTFCFNWFQDHRAAFKNLYQALKPGGEAAILFVLSTPMWDGYHMYIDNPKWTKYLQNVETGIPDSHFKKHGVPYYKDLLEDIGFNVFFIEEKSRAHVYPDDETGKDSCFTICGFSKHIPEDLKEEFKKDFFHGILKYNGRSFDGKPVLYYKTLSLLLQKPNKEEKTINNLSLCNELRFN